MDASILWRRLDAPGHDACRLTASEAGWRVEGTAVLRLGALPARLAYSLTCDRSWRSERGFVSGWVGANPIDVTVTRTAAGVWSLNGAVVAGLEGCVDLDLGFTPATNLTQLRRLQLAPGSAAEVDVAWFDVEAGRLDVLAQRYERRSETTYWYESPRFEYQALLEVTASGLVRRYPGLWEVEAEG